jgi:hypothetical protein
MGWSGLGAGLGWVGLPSRLWQSKASLWLWLRHQTAVFKQTEALLGLQGKHTLPESHSRWLASFLSGKNTLSLPSEA